MIEEIILNHIKKKLNADCVMEEKEGEALPLVVIERIGGESTDFLHTSTFTVSSYAESMYKSAKLNDEVKNVLKSAIELDEITSIKIEDYNATDEQKMRYCYQLVANVIHY